MLTKLALTGSLAAFVALSGTLAWALLDRSRLKVANASLNRSVAALEAQRDQAREAQAVAEAYQARAQELANEYDRFRDQVRRGPDEPTPGWMLDHLGRLGVVRPAD